ncbi:MAG: helix-turn-helix transcriptional regulator [Thainema sp.]
MSKKVTAHLYGEFLAFNRLILLIATLARFPGVGCLHSDASIQEKQSALREVQEYMQQVAMSQGITLPEYSIHTLRKDLECLKRYGILEKRRYRWGYYLGIGVMNRQELQVALNVLESKAKYQRDPTASQVYQSVTRRMGGAKHQSELLYPVRAQLNKSIVHTDPDDLITKAHYRQTLFHEIETVERCILQGTALQLCRTRDPYGSMGKGSKLVYPLQIVHYNNAWYLLYEHCDDGYLAIERFDRFDDNCQVITSNTRSIADQRKSLEEAHNLLQAGWGVYLGQPAEQKLERDGKLDFFEVKARFFGNAIPFILEGDRRHPTQEIIEGPYIGNGNYEYVDYIVSLPPRAFTEFSYWIYKYIGKVKVLSPLGLVKQHHDLLQQALKIYSSDL